MTHARTSEPGPRLSEPSDGPRVPGLDGLRGLAVLLVMWFHTTHIKPDNTFDSVFRDLSLAGWAGVDLFFVLSGFLITGILLRTAGRKGWLLSFYGRRFLRIVPLAYVVIAVCCLLVPALWADAKTSPWIDFYWICKAPADNQAWLWTFLANVKIAMPAVAPNSQWCFGPLDALWSLAIEEQFYLIWPFIVWLAGRKGTFWTCIALIAISPLCRAIMLRCGVNTSAVYVLTFTRMDTLAVGGLLACIAGSPGGIDRLVPIARVLVPVWLLALIALGVVEKSFISVNRAMQVMGYSMIALFFGGVLVLTVGRVWVNRESGANGKDRPASPRLLRVLSNPVLTLVGKYSYAMYLLHWPVQAAFSKAAFKPVEVPRLWGSQLPGLLAFYAATWTITLALSAFSWWALESRVLRLKKWFPRPE